MRRILCIIMVLLLLPVCAHAEASAYDFALELSKIVEQMSDVRKASLEDAKNRVIWTDSRANARCALVVYGNESAAGEAELTDSTPDTAVRAVKDCVLYLDSDMGADAILDYQMALAEILGENLNGEEPDYILNVNTEKFHYPYCSSVKDMKETNKQAYIGERADVIEQGYIPCKRCNP